MDLLDLWFYFIAIPSMKGWTNFFVTVGILAALPSIFLYINKEDSGIKASKLSFRPFLGILLGCFLIALPLSLLPNDRQIMLLTGAYVTTNIEGIDKLPNNIVNAANEYLESISKSYNKGE